MTTAERRLDLQQSFSKRKNSLLLDGIIKNPESNIDIGKFEYGSENDNTIVEPIRPGGNSKSRLLARLLKKRQEDKQVQVQSNMR